MWLTDQRSLDSTIQLVDPIFVGVGKVLTPSGRGIRRDALLLPEVTADALVAINSLLDRVCTAPDDDCCQSLDFSIQKQKDSWHKTVSDRGFVSQVPSEQMAIAQNFRKSR